MASTGNGSILDLYAIPINKDFEDDIITETGSELSSDDMDRTQSQQRLYIINRSGSGEAQYVLLNKKRTGIDSYGVRLETWRLIKNVADFGVAVIDNVLYIIGGYDVINCRHLHRVVKYDPYDFSWRECSPLMKARAKMGICTLEGKIYVCGGERSDGRASCSCEVYNPELDQWSETGLMVAPRKNHCCDTYQSEMYCAGGDFGTRSHDNFWIFENERWQELDFDYPPKLPRCLDRYAMCTVGHKTYFIGGVSCRVSDNGEGNKFTTERGIFSYTHNIRQKSFLHGLQSDVISPWSTKYSSMVRPRHSCAAHPVGKKIYVFGGCHLETGQDVRVCECFDTDKGTWEDEFHFRKGDLTSVVSAVLEVPRRHDAEKIKYYLKWVMW
ncbi:protein polyubiquitination [Mactra antiquata]